MKFLKERSSTKKTNFVDLEEFHTTFIVNKLHTVIL